MSGSAEEAPEFAPATLSVQGAGCSTVNGIFHLDGEFAGQPRWHLVGRDVWVRKGSSGDWCIVNNADGKGSNKKYYYRSTCTAGTEILTASLVPDSDGAMPAPTISSPALPTAPGCEQFPLSHATGSTADWPMDKLQQALAAQQGLSSPTKGFAVVLSTGALNPVHLGHVQLLYQAKARLERDSEYAVVGAWVSPSHDGYLQPKAKQLGTVGLSAAFRLEVTRQAVKDDPLVAIGAWEANKAGFWPDFPQVAKNLRDELAKHPETFHVFYACGTDHAEKCQLYHGMTDGIGVVVVPREGDTVGPESILQSVYVAEPAIGDVASFSSTKIRSALEQGDRDYLSKALPCDVAEFLLQPPDASLHTFSDDFRKLGVLAKSSAKSPVIPAATPACSRKIFISFSSLMAMWDAKGETMLQTIPENSLFFFGSKRSWVFPSTEQEARESRSNNPKYTSPKYKLLRELVASKELRGEVCWLKPEGFKYDGSLYHGDPGAFHRASQWLQTLDDPVTGKKYEPLLLDRSWWEVSFNRTTAKYTKAVGIIIKNYENGAHDYAPVKELLHQSNPTLEIVH